MPPFCSYVFRVKTKEERGSEKGVNPPLTHPSSSQLFGLGKQENFYSMQEAPKIWVYSENKKNVKPYLSGLSCVRTKLLGMLGLVFSFYHTILSAWVVYIQHKLWPQKKKSVSTSWKWPRYNSTSSSKYMCWYGKRKCQPLFIAEGLVPR